MIIIRFYDAAAIAVYLYNGLPLRLGEETDIIKDKLNLRQQLCLKGGYTGDRKRL